MRHRSRQPRDSFTISLATLVADFDTFGVEVGVLSVPGTCGPVWATTLVIARSEDAHDPKTRIRAVSRCAIVEDAVMPSRDELIFELFCPICGQKLALPVRGLSHDFLCPRCHSKHRGSELVARNEALPVLSLDPSTSTPSPTMSSPRAADPLVHSGKTLGWEPPEPPPEPIAWIPPAWAAAPSVPIPSTVPATSAPGPDLTPGFVPDPACASAPSTAIAPDASPAQWASPADLDALPPEFPRTTSLGSRIGGALHGLTRWCVAIDRFLEGLRALSILLVSLLGMITGIGQTFFDVPAWAHVATLVVFGALLGVFAWAYVANLHAKASQNGWGAALGESFAALRGYLSSADESDEPLSEQERGWAAENNKRRQAAMIASLAVVAYPIASIAGLVVPSAAEGAAIVQVFAVVVLVIGLWSWARLRASAPFRPRRDNPSGPSDFGRLPSVLVLARTRDNTQSLACIGGDAILSEMLQELPRWRPGRREHEQSYEQSLVKFLRNRIPHIVVRTQTYMTANDGETLRIDVVVDGRIGIEIKRNLRNSAEVDRCFAQIQRYARTWRKRGPLFLLVCESEREFESSAYLARLTSAQSVDTPFKILIAGHRVR